MATAKQIAWRKEFARRYGQNKGKKVKHNARRRKHNPRGQVFTGKTFRPTLPKGPKAKVFSALRRKYKHAAKLAPIQGKKRKKGMYKANRKPVRRKSVRRKAHKNPITTFFNRKRKLSSKRARALSMKRWYGKKKARKNRRYHRNFSVGGIFAKAKSIASMKTVQEGLAVLVGAVVATGAPSLLGTYASSNWANIAATLVAAGLAGILTSYVAPQFVGHVAAGGVVVVGLKLITTYAPQVLAWNTVLPGVAQIPSAVPAMKSGFLLPATRGKTGVGGYLVPPPGARSISRLPMKAGFSRAAGEGFGRVPKI